jgi:hypothetical protein
MALKKGTRIINNGPKDENNGAGVFRFIRKGNRKDIDLSVNQVVTVGEEIDAEEGNALLNSTTWEFEKLEEKGSDD